MKVAQYTFQSPSTSPVQVGKLDPSSVKEESASQAPQQNAIQAKSAGEILSTKTDTANVITPTVNQERLLDVYA